MRRQQRCAPGLASGLAWGALLVLGAACGGGDATQATVTPYAAPAGVTPRAEDLVAQRYVLDAAVELSLDGSEAGQVAVLSHTARRDGGGDPVASPVPQECPETAGPPDDPSPCAFRLEVFAPEGGAWASVFVRDDRNPTGSLQSVRADSFRAGDGREVLVVTYAGCSGDGLAACPPPSHVLFTMKDGAVRLFRAFAGDAGLGEGSATFAVAAFDAGAEPCCPTSRLMYTVAIDPALGELAVTEVRLDACTIGVFEAEAGGAAFIVRCEPGERSSIEATRYRVDDPALTAGIVDGDHVRVEFTVEECPDSLLDCEPTRVTPVASVVTVVGP